MVWRDEKPNDNRARKQRTRKVNFQRERERNWRKGVEGEQLLLRDKGPFFVF